jgi:hypothetical protein
MIIEKVKKFRYHVTGVNFPFMEFTERYKSIRKKAKYKGFQCWKCNIKFKIGDKIGLLFFKGHGNRVICINCSIVIEKELYLENTAKELFKNG